MNYPALLAQGNSHEGNAKVTNHLKEKLSPGDIKIALARIVYVVTSLHQGGAVNLVKEIDMALVKDFVLPAQYKILERLKATAPEAYFYWASAVGTKER